jgi:hypothetical protein
VAHSHWRVPVRPDLQREPLDLKGSGWPRSVGTPFFRKQNMVVDLRSNGQRGKGEEVSPAVRVPARCARGVASGDVLEVTGGDQG